jgi:peptide chain release factor 2
MQKIADIKKESDIWHSLNDRVSYLREYVDLLNEDPSVEDEIKQETEAIARELEEQEFKLAFSDPMDIHNAILSIHAGAGGTEAQDWANMLLQMYTRYAARKDFKTEILNISPGEEAGIKSVDLSVSGEYAYGYLRGEFGTHRLIRLSPFDADHARHTSFALVEVMPEIDDDVTVSISPEDIKVEMFRSSGPGGQNVQKVSTAVRIIHVPSGIVVTSQSERSQFQNKEIAMRLLKAKLYHIELQKKEEELAKIKGVHVSAEFGTQIRTYTLHPYRMVKDHRTNFQSNDPDGVLMGDLDDVISAYLRSGLRRTV